MIDTAFLDRMHMYIPGWEIPKLRPEFLLIIGDLFLTTLRNF